MENKKLFLTGLSAFGATIAAIAPIVATWINRLNDKIDKLENSQISLEDLRIIVKDKISDDNKLDKIEYDKLLELINGIKDNVLSVQEIEDKFNAMIGKADASLLKDIHLLEEKMKNYLTREDWLKWIISESGKLSTMNATEIY